MLSFKCPQCHVALRVADDKAGQKGKCPKCQAPLVIPQAPLSQAKVPTPTAPPPASAPAPAASPVRPISAALYVGLFLGLRVLGALISVGIYLFAPRRVLSYGPGLQMGRPDAGALEGASILFSIAGLVFGLILIYKMWEAIQAGPARTTPGKAVGFLFIPYFNLYWMFVVLYGWAKDYNQFVKLRRIRALPVSEELPLGLCVFSLLGGMAAFGAFVFQVAVLGVLILVILDVFAALYFWVACEGINVLARTPPELLAPAPTVAGQALAAKAIQGKVSALAIVGFVLGLLGLFSGGLTAVVGLGLSFVGLMRIIKSGGALRGKGLAIAGLVISGISVLFLLLIFFPMFLKSLR